MTITIETTAITFQTCFSSCNATSDMGHIVYISRVILQLCDISLRSRLTFSNIKKIMEWTLWARGEGVSG